MEFSDQSSTSYGTADDGDDESSERQRTVQLDDHTALENGGIWVLEKLGFRFKDRNSNQKPMNHTVHVVHMAPFSLQFDDPDAERAFRRYVQDTQIFHTTVVPVLILIMCWEVERALSLAENLPWYIFACEALLFGIHSLRLLFLFPGVRSHFSVFSRRKIYTAAACVAICTSLIFNANAVTGVQDSQLLLPNLMLEMVALQVSRPSRSP